MAFSCMSGRLRSLPTTRAFTRERCAASDNDTDGADGTARNLHSDDYAPWCFSTVPCTLPHGLLSIHHGHPSDHNANGYGNGSGNVVGNNDDQESSGAVIRKSYKYGNFGMAEIHRTMGEVIIDHCWAKVNVKAEAEAEEGVRSGKNVDVNGNGNGNGRGNENKNYDKNEHEHEHEHELEQVEKTLLVLAILTRKREKATKDRDRGEKSNLDNDGDNDTDTDNGYGDDSMAVTRLHVHWREEFNNGDDIGLELDVDDESSFPAENQRLLTFPYTANNIVMNESIMVVGSSSGATVYHLEDIIRERNSNGSGGGDHDGVKNLKLMNTFILHAMDISSYHFVAVSGNRVGVWNVRQLEETLDAMNMDIDIDREHGGMERRNNENRNGNGNGNGTCTKPIAVWSTKVEGKISRITSVEISKANVAASDGKYIALVDWNGFAVVFRRGGGYGDGDRNGSAGAGVTAAQWERVCASPPCPPMETNRDDINSETTNGADHMAPCWEVGISSKDHPHHHHGRRHDNQNIVAPVAPSFVSICEIVNHVDVPSTCTTCSSIDEKMSIMAVSSPGSAHLCIYDLDRACLWTDTSTLVLPDESDCGEVQGLVSLQMKMHRKGDGQYSECSILISIDDSDRIVQVNLSSLLKLKLTM